MTCPLEPQPFFGRETELDGLRSHLAVAPLVSLHGPAGVGKSRLLQELAAGFEVPVTIVQCVEGDRAVSVRSRIERKLRCHAGGLEMSLQHQARVIAIDDIHHLSLDELTSLLMPIVPSATALGRLVLIGRDPMVAAGPLMEMGIGGLDVDASGQLWANLEASLGEVPGAFDSALARTRGAPMGLRREYARARFGADAWALSSLSADARAALESMAVLRIPVAPAGLAAMSPDTAVEAAIDELSARQLIDGLPDGRLEAHELVRLEALRSLTPARRRELELRAAEIVNGSGGGGGARLVWDAGDDGALGALDPVTRLCESIMHHVHAGDLEAGTALLLAHRDLGGRRGAAGEFEVLIDALDPSGKHPELSALRLELVIRSGRYSEALDRVNHSRSSALLHAELTMAIGDTETARAELLELVRNGDVNVRAAASVLLCELDMLCGDVARAGSWLERIGELSAVEPAVRVAAYLATAKIDEWTGRIAAMRSTLARAHGVCSSGASWASEPAVIVEARRAAALIREGRLSEAAAAIEAATLLARDLDSMAAADEIRRVAALLAQRRGDNEAAEAGLRALVHSRRSRGDELGALRSELELAELEIARGRPAGAVELASAVATSAQRRKLVHLAARAELVIAATDLFEHRIEAAKTRLADVHTHALDVASVARWEVFTAHAMALLGQRVGAVEHARAAGALEVRDDVDRTLAAAEVALAGGDVNQALEMARETAVMAERLHRRSELAAALVIVARLELARGDRASARAAATRGAREAAAAGLVRVRVHALLALSALARDDDDSSSAVAYARDAAEIAICAGLPVERLVAHAALEAIAGHEAVADPAAPSAATMASTAIDGAARLLADLGLTAQRPFRVIDAEGLQSDVADSNPEILRLSTRSLAVDGVREVILRKGQELADLRRRSLLKRLLFMFASAPGKVFSKEAIVQAVWNVEYHPLRHDAALFTNIMRIRRLLGEDGAEIVRVTDDGYRFVPPRDFLFVFSR
ncbi:MAG: winged helix-turn-helix domain-containing protein [Kofleriaceae bacterium]